MTIRSDKELERLRYDERSRTLLSNEYELSLDSGSSSVPIPLQSPYVRYEELISKYLSDGQIVLEIGSGTGAFTGALLLSGAQVFATDISANSLSVLKRKAAKFVNLRTQVTDMECLSFEDESFDIVTSAGSLSYGDNLVVMNEIYRVLKPGGLFICVDSLNHNPIYRFNRWLHYKKSTRTLSTLNRMPTLNLINKYKFKFKTIEVQYFGCASWLAPIFSNLFGDCRMAVISDWFDRVLNVRKSAFKFVMVVMK